MHLIGRRSFVRGLGLGAGAHLLAPIARGLVSEAMGQAPAQKRFVMFNTTGGLSRDYWPKPGASQTDFTLSEAYSAFAPWKADMTFLEVFSNPFTPDLHGNGISTFNAVNGVAKPHGSIPGGISIDRHIASKLGVGKAFSSLAFSQVVGGDQSEHESILSDGPGKSFPEDLNPVPAFARIFGGVEPKGPAAAPGAPPSDGRILDYLRADANKLRARLAGREREKLDQYLESVGALQDQIRLVGQAQLSCNKPMAPDAATYPNLWWRKSESIKAGMQAWLDMTVMALACGLTNVVSVGLCEGDLGYLGALAGYPTMYPGTHQMWHGKGSPADHVRYYKYNNDNHVYMWEKLKAFKEGNGTIADGTLMMSNVHNGAEHHNGLDTHFAVLLGNAGGAFKSGRYISYPKKANFVGDLYASMANAVGVPTPKFGDPNLSKGPLPGLA
jgi:hypothetical protein